jgi:ribosomal protein S18 acetylase RimI-like enzyme
MLFSNVAPDFQGKGIGKRLIEARLSALRSFPYLAEIFVTVNDRNAASIKALQAFGFQWSHDEPDYYGPGKHRSLYRLPVLNLQADITGIKPQSMAESM